MPMNSTRYPSHDPVGWPRARRISRSRSGCARSLPASPHLAPSLYRGGVDRASAAWRAELSQQEPAQPRFHFLGHLHTARFTDQRTGLPIRVEVGAARLAVTEVHLELF